jgi:hypothetical protein
VTIRASGVGVLIHYRFADHTRMAFRLSELFSTNRELLAAMIRLHGPAEIVDPEKELQADQEPIPFTNQSRLALVKVARQLARSATA